MTRYCANRAVAVKSIKEILITRLRDNIPEVVFHLILT